MSKRLRELAAEAYRQVHPGPDPYGEADATWLGFDKLEKVFAELIVAECISTLDQDDGATHHGELLREHFGVESA
jgi:hypothetical protein